MGVRKVRHEIIDFKLLANRSEGLANAGYNKPKWIEFCECMMNEGYQIKLYEAPQTFSKYITVMKGGAKSYKVRFSNHKPIKALEMKKTCNFFVGWTHLGISTTNQAIQATREHFKKEEEKHRDRI